jgi:hypothetical protein
LCHFPVEPSRAHLAFSRLDKVRVPRKFIHMCFLAQLAESFLAGLSLITLAPVSDQEGENLCITVCIVFKR